MTPSLRKVIITQPTFLLLLIKLDCETFSLKGVLKIAKEKCEQILVVAGDSNPGSPVLATGAVTTELQQPSTSRVSHCSYILLSNTTCCSLILNRPPIMCRQNSFLVDRKHLPLLSGAIICGLKRLFHIFP